MNKENFLVTLRLRLCKLPEYEIEKILSFYEESIGDRVESGLTEQEAVAELGDVEKIAKEILVDEPISSLVSKKIKKSRKKIIENPFLIILLICGAIIWLPLTIVILAIIFSIYVFIWSIVVTLFSVLIGLGAGGFCIIGGLIAIFTVHWTAGLATLGIGIACLGLFLICLQPICFLAKQVIALTAVFGRKIKKILFKKEVMGE